MKTLELKRESGQYKYILETALWNPNVVIVCLNTYHVEALKYRYNKMKKETPWLKRIALKLFGKNQNFTPVFLSLNQCGEFFSPIVPVLIDNSVKLVAFPITKDSNE